MLTPNAPNGIKGVVFDAVGTLIEPFPSVAAAYAMAASRQGVEIPAAMIKTRFHQAFREDDEVEARGPLATDEANEVRRWQRIVANVLPEVPDSARAFSDLWEHFAQPGAWRCFPDVARTVEWIHGSGRVTCIASNFDSRLRGVVAGLPALEPCMDALVISSEIGYRKPHPAMYEAACARLGLGLGQVLWVGDDLENDVIGPTRSGLRALLLDRKPAEASPVPRILSLTDLLSYLDSGGESWTNLQR